MMELQGVHPAVIVHVNSDQYVCKCIASLFKLVFMICPAFK